jgi:hypothetical protein
MTKTITKKVTARFDGKYCDEKCRQFDDSEFDGDRFVNCELYKKSIGSEILIIDEEMDIEKEFFRRCRSCIKDFGR